MEGRQPLRSWDELKLAVMERFSSSLDGSSCERLLALRQYGSMGDYRRLFEVMAALLPTLPEPVLGSAFINGLRPEIKSEIRTFKRKGLGPIMDLAQWVDERSTSLWAARDPIHSSRPSSGWSPNNRTVLTSILKNYFPRL